MLTGSVHRGRGSRPLDVTDTIAQPITARTLLLEQGPEHGNVVGELDRVQALNFSAVPATIERAEPWHTSEHDALIG